MKCWIVCLALALLIAACRAPDGRTPPPPSPTFGLPAATEAESTPGAHRGNPFGLIVGQGRRPETIAILNDLGAGWARLNEHLDGDSPDYAAFLNAGIDLVITFSNENPSNADTTYGSPADWPNSGFPYRSREDYQRQVTEILFPLIPWLDGGRQVWVQAENEVGDAALNPNAAYWRGTTDQYLLQLDAFYEATKSVDARFVVVLSSFPSEGLDALIDESDPHHAFSVQRVTRLLTEGRYDAVDLHFYGCLEDIPAKVAWVTSHMPSERIWISTENGGPDPRCPSTPLSWQDDLSAFEQEQARQVAPRLSACYELGGRVCLWFSLFDLVREVDTFNHLGLLDPRDLPPREKPAYVAFNNFVEENAP